MKRLIADRKVMTTTDMFKSTLVTVLNFSRYVDCSDVSETVSEPISVESDIAQSEPPMSSIPSSLFGDELPAELPASNKAKKKQEVDCDFIVNLYHDRCPSFPKVLKLSDKRKAKVRIRFEEMDFSYETLQEVFDRCEASHFMRGDNARGWRADFDWIFANAQNWVKVLEGKYDNRTTPQYSINETKQADKYAKRRGADSAALTSEDFTDSI
ncbi:MAG: hypothetical protein NC548_52905 [Lachnospiraceae bacterium]|nr:hypothetical protein [Lachnospiraceae bacterium]